MTADEAAALYRLMTWLSPSFPVGAFSYSSGIEWAVEAAISPTPPRCGWLAAMLTDGSGFCDAVFLAQAHRAASAGDDVGLREIAELAAAFVPSRERQLETTTQGRAFIDIARSAWACEGSIRGRRLRRRDRLSRRRRPRQRGACDTGCANRACVPACGGVELDFRRRAAGAARADRQPAYSRSHRGRCGSTAKRALESSLDDLGSATFRADLASLRHETQYTRLFRS
jgi:urease accessory protein